MGAIQEIKTFEIFQKMLDDNNQKFMAAPYKPTAYITPIHLK